MLLGLIEAIGWMMIIAGVVIMVGTPADTKTAPPLPSAPPTPPPRGRTPGGLSPEEFPCCPFCKTRNRSGMPQQIFWDGRTYHCSKGHTFQKNGLPF